MANPDILETVQHYQRSIEKNSNDIARLLYCIGKLSKLPITVDHLQVTGVGRTVNALRKFNGELGTAAEAVVNKWKNVVASSGQYQEDENLDENDNSEPCLKEKPEKLNDEQKKETTTKRSHREHEGHKSGRKEKDPANNKEKHGKHHSSNRVESSDSGKEKPDKQKSSSHKRRSDEERNGIESVATEEKKNKRHHKHKSSKEDEKKSKGKDHKSSSDKHKSHSKHGENAEKQKLKTQKNPQEKTLTTNLPPPLPPTTTGTGVTINTEASTSKRRHEDAAQNEKAQKRFKAHEAKGNNKQEAENNETAESLNDDDGIDSSMGANFADVLGMLNMPQKKAKKSISALKQTTMPAPAPATAPAPALKTVPAPVSKLHSQRNFDGPSTSSQINLEKKPVLLNSNVKLAPLDLSIALDLPVISNNYKPLPPNPTVMDCIFNSSTSSSSRAPPPRMLSDAEALSHGISSKTIRTKIYSGIKTGQRFQPASLFDICIRLLQKNIDAIEYTGGVPFDLLRPVLERASPHQLCAFEEYNPYLMEDSDVLWQQHVQRTYRGQRRQEMESWREMFLRCQEEQDRRLSLLTQNIKQSQKVMAEPVRKTQLAFVDTLVKPPRNVMRKQEQYGTKSKPVATPAARVATLHNVTPNAAKTGDARLRTAAALKIDPAQAVSRPSRPKKAPLMAKTLQFIRGRQRR